MLIIVLRCQFASGRFWNRMRRPDLAMRMRTAGAHHRATVLEDLHVMDVGLSAQLLKLLGPGSHNQNNVLRFHRGQRQIVPGRKAHYAAAPGFRLGNNQALVLKIEPACNGTRFEGSKIILENEGGLVLRIMNSASARVPRTEVTGRIVFWLSFNGNFLHRTLPWPQRPVRRNQDPLPGQWIEPPVWVLGYFQNWPFSSVATLGGGAASLPVNP